MWYSRVFVLLRILFQFPIVKNNGRAVPGPYFMCYNFCFVVFFVVVIFIMPKARIVMREIMKIPFYASALACTLSQLSTILNPIFRSARLCGVLNSFTEIDQLFGTIRERPTDCHFRTLRLLSFIVFYQLFSETMEYFFPTWSVDNAVSHLIHQYMNLIIAPVFLQLCYVMRMVLQRIRLLNECLQRMKEQVIHTKSIKVMLHKQRISDK